MKFAPSSIPLLLLVSAAPCHALTIRTYTPSVHDRFTPFPNGPVMNPNFLFTASRFTGVGYASQSANEQFCLVTPRHFVFATHVGLTVGTTINFVGSDGAIVTRTVASVSNISNDTGANSDLIVGTFDSAVPSTVSPLPWLNLSNETSYVGLSLMALGYTFSPVDGHVVLVGGSGTLTSFSTVTESGSINATRMSSFSYSTIGGGANDCHFDSGDSGAPTFAAATNGEPALIGTHSTLTSAGVVYQSSDTFYPHYATKVDALLAPQGYRVRPATATATTVGLTSAPSAATLTQGQTGGVSFTVTNTGTAVAGNVELTLTFPDGTAPDSVTVPGWVVEARSGNVWSLRIATLAAKANGVATVSWNVLPTVTSLPITTTLHSDSTGTVAGQTTLTLVAPPPPPSPYTTWSASLSDPSQTGDPDGDGVDNLLEYALGGDPTVASLALPSGQPMLPQIAPVSSDTTGQLDFSYPERTDAAARSLSYIVETSPDLVTWTAGLPDGAVSSTTDFSPAISGFALRHIVWTPAADSAMQFLRLRVQLSDSQ